MRRFGRHAIRWLLRILCTLLQEYCCSSEDRRDRASIDAEGASCSAGCAATEVGYRAAQLAGMSRPISRSHGRGSSRGTQVSEWPCTTGMMIRTGLCDPGYQDCGQRCPSAREGVRRHLSPRRATTFACGDAKWLLRATAKSLAAHPHLQRAPGSDGHQSPCGRQSCLLPRMRPTSAMGRRSRRRGLPRLSCRQE